MTTKGRREGHGCKCNTKDLGSKGAMLVEEGCQLLEKIIWSPSKAWVECQELGLYVRALTSKPGIH